MPLEILREMQLEILREMLLKVLPDMLLMTILNAGKLYPTQLGTASLL